MKILNQKVPQKTTAEVVKSNISLKFPRDYFGKFKKPCIELIFNWIAIHALELDWNWIE